MAVKIIYSISLSRMYCILLDYIIFYRIIARGCTLEDQVGLRPGRPADNGTQEGDYSDWVAWRKGKVGLPGLSFLPPFSLSPRLPRQSSPPPVAHYLQGAMAWGPKASALSASV